MAGAFAVGAVVEFGKTVVNAAEQEQVAVTKTKKAVQDASLGWFSHKKAIEETIKTQARATGFMQHDLYDAFANMIRTTGSVSGALKLNGVAMDIARTKGMDLASAQSLLARVWNGSFMGLKRLGIAVTPVTAAQDKLKASSKDFITAELIVAKAHGAHGLALQQLKEKLQSSAAEQLKAAKADDKRATAQQAIAAATAKFSGQAAAYAHTAAGAQDRVREAMNELEATAGKQLLPTIANLATELANELPAALKEVKADTQDVTGFFKEYGGVIVPVTGAVVGLKVALGAYTVASRLATSVAANVKGVYQSVTGVFVTQEGAAARLSDATLAVAAAERVEADAALAVTVALRDQQLAEELLIAARTAEIPIVGEVAAAEALVAETRGIATQAILAETRAQQAQTAATLEAKGAQAELSGAMSGFALGPIIGGIGLAVGALVALYQTSGTVRGALDGLASVFKSDAFSSRDAAKATEQYRQALDDLKHVQQGVVDAHDRLASAKLQVQEADARVTQLQRQGKTGSLEYKEAQLQLREAHHGVRAAVLALADAEKKRNQTVGEGNKGISQAHILGIQLSKDAESSLALWKINPRRAAEAMGEFNKKLEEMTQKAGGSKTRLGEALGTIERLAKATGKPPSAAEWDKVFAHLVTLPNKSLSKAQTNAELGANKVGAQIKAGIVTGVGGLDSQLANYISQQIQTALENVDIPGHSPPGHAAGEMLGKPMADGVIAMWVTGTKPLGNVMSSTIKDAITQAQQSVADAIGQAKSNLQSIGGSVAGLAGDFFGAPQQNQQQREALRAAKLGLANANVSGASRDEIAAARAAVKAAQAEINRTMLQRRLSDLSDELGRGQITKHAFDRDVDGLLGKLGLSYAKLKKEMGIAFADQYRAEVQGLKAQAGAIVAGPRRNDITGFEPQIIKPLDALKQGTQQVRDAIHSSGKAALTESKKQTAHLAKIAQQTADLKGAEAVIAGHNRAVNPNHVAARAKR